MNNYKGGKKQKGSSEKKIQRSAIEIQSKINTQIHMMMMCVFRMTDSPPIPQEGKNTFLFISMIPLFFVNVILSKRIFPTAHVITTQEKIYLYHGTSSLYSHPRSNNHSKTSNNQSPLQKGCKLQSLTSRVG